MVENVLNIKESVIKVQDPKIPKVSFHSKNNVTLSKGIL